MEYYGGYSPHKKFQSVEMLALRHFCKPPIINSQCHQIFTEKKKLALFQENPFYIVHVFLVQNRLC